MPTPRTLIFGIGKRNNKKSDDDDDDDNNKQGGGGTRGVRRGFVGVFEEAVALREKHSGGLTQSVQIPRLLIG